LHGQIDNRIRRFIRMQRNNGTAALDQLVVHTAHGDLLMIGEPVARIHANV